MKTIKYVSAVLTVVMLVAFRPVQAQLFPNTYIHIDWQMNVPLGDGFADKGSGWGMSFEGGYFVTPQISVGPFISYHTNLEPVCRQTLVLSPAIALTTGQKQALFQLPFGLAGRYTFMKGSVIQPYVGLKLGASYAEMSSYYYIIKHTSDSWGFYLQPELGVGIFPVPSRRFGFHLALYYGFATNNDRLLIYSFDHLNSLGLRLGVSF